MDGEIRHPELPMSRIRPIVYLSSALEDEFERLTSLDQSSNADLENLQLIGVVELYDNTSYSVVPLIITLYK